LNTLNADPPDGGGPGENVSTPSKFVGLNVPETRGPLSNRLLGAASSNVKVIPLTGIEPPTSDMMIAFCPPGATSIMSTSSGNVWLRLFKVTVSLLITSPGGLPEMVRGDGNGLATPRLLIVMAVGLHPLGQVPVIVTVKLQLPPPAALQLTVVVPIGKNDPDGGEQATAPQSPTVVGGG
jgi:hypothetical protein